METNCIIGIAGGTASGKTTIIKQLKESFGEDIGLISHDAYYRPHDDLSFEERASLNYDHPSAFETERMIADVELIKQGRSIQMPVYDFSMHTRTDEVEVVEPKKVIIIEGILILEDPRLRDLMDIKVFVDADADERLMRRIVRDIKKRGRTVESVMTQYRDTVKPMHEQFVEPTKKYADIIIPRGGKNKTALDILTEHVKMMLD